MSPLESLVSAAKALEEENIRLKAQPQVWQIQNEKNSLANELKKAQEKLNESQRESSRLRDEVWHWRKAVRYEQALKKPPKKVRHLPIFNEIRRAKYTDPEFVNAERVYLKHWRDENKRKSGLNGGKGLLELLLSEDNGYAADISQRDATVAATVIQWLGTNCGRCFVMECDREIEAANKKHRDRRLKAVRAAG
jgi:hypothetical protein